MAQVQIFWDPKGIELNNLNKKTKSGDPADGDTPYVRMPIRMLGIDTPETTLGGSAATVDGKLTELHQLLSTGNFDAYIDAGLKNHLLPRLQNNPGTLHKQQGADAKDYFKNLLEQRLLKPNGSNRSLYIRSADEHFDRYGRLLAYISPAYTKAELAAIGPNERKTFNLNLVESGWASTIMIYPNLPKNSDLRITQVAAKNAYDNNLGAWAGNNILTAYEYRMCLKLHKACKDAKPSQAFYIRESSWVSRFCMDMTTLKVYNPQQYYKVEPYNRVFIWANDIREAVAELNLIAAE